MKSKPKFDTSLNVRMLQSERDTFEEWCEKACVSPAALIRQCMRCVVEYRAEELDWPLTIMLTVKDD